MHYDALTGTGTRDTKAFIIIAQEFSKQSVPKITVARRPTRAILALLVAKNLGFKICKLPFMSVGRLFQMLHPV